jgi:protein-S-isoprenylcysteine O-methyltransferase Ste14
VWLARASIIIGDMGDTLMLTTALPLLFVIAAIVGLGVTGNLFSWSPFVIAAQVVAVGLSVWARRTFQDGSFRVTAAPGSASLITRGPYRFIRHPMYAAALLFVGAGVVSHASVVTLAIGIAVAAVIVARVIAEDRLLRAQYPDYADYAHSTKALVPYVF